MDFQRRQTVLITCGPGLGEYLRNEVEALGYTPGVVTDTGVTIKASLAETMRLNLYLRTAYNVYYRLAEFRCNNAEALYRKVNSLPWEEIIPANEYLCVTSRVNTPSIDNSMFPNLKVKDAIVDRIKARHDRRPDSGREKDNVVVHLNWTKERADLYLNTSGRKLSDRGYRKIPGRAPLRESLAAGLLLATGYDGSTPLVAPMCGSGALAIEGALLATGRAPGLLRDNYGFMHLMGFVRRAWEKLRQEARNERHRAEPAPIIATDIDPAAISAARRSAATAGMDRLIDFSICDYADTPVPEGGDGVVILNPEYGERLGEEEELGPVYKGIGDFFKSRCAGYTGYIFTGNMGLAKRVGLRASRRLIFFNGTIECRLLKYELYKGSRKDSPPD